MPHSLSGDSLAVLLAAPSRGWLPVSFLQWQRQWEVQAGGTLGSQGGGPSGKESTSDRESLKVAVFIHWAHIQ